ncbi:restriction endonuclease subunit S (plasmid) [Tistrella mobilis]|uniref:restriction endonuclease subunit S n=1 Tax=Tistrella mobilis TaxID=171437 RepID=UPI0035565BB1
MSFQRYPAYRDSGVEWLGEVPAHWEVCPMKRFARFAYGEALPADIRNEEGMVPVFGSNGVVGYHDRSNTESPAIFIGRKGSCGALNWSDVSSFGIDTVYYVDNRSCDPDIRWMFWLLHIAELSSVSQDTGVPGLPRDFAHERILPRPPHEEQRLIATFLDRETARIDALVTEQEKLIDLLKEKRQAVISRAVTKGLDPQVPMKDSGIAWLGEVPAHWDVVPVSYRYEVQLGKMLDGNKITGKNLRPYLRVFDVQWDKINIDDLPEMDFDQEDRVRYSLRAGDLLVNEGGSYVGRSAVWRGEMEECYYQKALHRLRPHDKMADTAEFFLFVMENATRQGVFVAGGNQATIEHLTAEALRRYRFAFPPRQEQEDIAAHLRRETERYGALITEAQKAITLLKERRAALISAAVTGRIDVRDRVAAGATEAA